MLRSTEDEPQVLDDEAYHYAKKRSQEAKLETMTRSATMGSAFFNKADGFLKLSRYEAAIERSLQRSLRELDRIRAAT